MKFTFPMTRLTWTIAWHEYTTNVRRPGFIFSTVLFPALGLIGVIIFNFFSGQASQFFQSQFERPNLPAGVVDQSGLFATSLTEPEYAQHFLAFNDEASARQAVSAEQISAFVVIPANYVERGGLTVYTQGGLSGLAALDDDELNALLVRGLLKGQVDQAVIERVIDSGDTNYVTLDSASNSAETANANSSPQSNNPINFFGGFFASYAMAILLFAAIFSSANYLLRSVSEEKENRVMEVVVSSVDATDLLWGKVFGLGALGLTQIGVWLISGAILSGGLGMVAVGIIAALNPGIFLLAGVYFILGFLLFAVLMATAGSLGTSMRESQQIAGLFSFMAATPWMVNGFLFANPNFIVIRILSWIPVSAPTMMMLRLPYGNVPIEDIIGSVSVLAISVPLVVWGGSKIFRTSLLMYGKRMSLKEIWATLRQS